MRLISYTDAGGRARVGALRAAGAAEYIDLAIAAPALPPDLGALVASADAMAAARAVLANPPKESVRSIGGTRFAPVVRRPGKILCLGLNYLDHAKEGGHKGVPEYPSFFMRGATSLVAHGEPMVRPRVSEKFDYEAELAFIVGRPARHLTAANALECIAGYSCFNDGSVRDYQRKTSQWTIGKNFDGSGAFGPWMVTPDELPAGGAGLRIQSRLNGKVMQDANTRDFLCPVIETLCLVTECLTLEPGDVVITGTPAGVGYARNPPVFMKKGDTIEVEIEGIGVLSNPVIDEA